ncbi:hypothetical protein [Brumicola pallidula]|jgi:hypothetical protein|uniref:Copper resistance protein B n=1 Tax=Brumicola pallidula DSM 14239 = ACAM 615 TaxID=1121922 RepID=K6ZKH6_9ALTE|nr:hypothetical protein [Glaciecola pallidula]GAC29393.1 hypothetical protein GPAL_2536 [Glaciecola pallidula DSM 14239 = ACAM 615]
MKHIAPIFMCLYIIMLNGFAIKSYASESVDKVYHPYVLPFEREFEWRFSSRKNDDGNELLQRIAYGQAISEYVTIEGYLVGERDADDNFGLHSYEIETRWMLTDQGQYWADWGALFELEKGHEKDSWEFTTGLLAEKEFGRNSLTINLLVTQNWGDDTDEKLQGEFRLKYRYRWIPEIQPAIEIYSNRDFFGIGPAFMGIKRFEGQRQLKWELGFIAGLNGNSTDHTLRFALEMEF